MGCCCSKTEEWSDSDSDSSLSDFPPYPRRITKTVEHRQHTTAGTQHGCLDAELTGDSRCKEEPEVLRNPTRGVGPTLESDPCVALDRRSTGGEEKLQMGQTASTASVPLMLMTLSRSRTSGQQMSLVHPLCCKPGY
ncbi:hypothetical protein D4764_10G0009410 [Takifugu flavidus]|uniref:Uncharacterized protein n=1 Tax=Takifugu flavidus TaxID=433684 RepID=A0A5C6PM39_9TELE|nr:hypothetical protein D4764_10G0009410 [Takifugu flavidus]